MCKYPLQSTLESTFHHIFAFFQLHICFIQVSAVFCGFINVSLLTSHIAIFALEPSGLVKNLTSLMTVFWTWASMSVLWASTSGRRCRPMSNIVSNLHWELGMACGFKDWESFPELDQFMFDSVISLILIGHQKKHFWRACWCPLLFYWYTKNISLSIGTKYHKSSVYNQSINQSLFVALFSFKSNVTQSASHNTTIYCEETPEVGLEIHKNSNLVYQHIKINK